MDNLLSDEEMKVQNVSSVDQLLSERFRRIILESPESEEFDVFGYKTGRDGYIRTVVLVQGKVAGEVIGANGETVKQLSAKYELLRMHVQRVLNFTTLTLSSKNKENLVRAQLEIWDIIGSSNATIIKSEIENVMLWRIMTNEEKAVFQAKYSVSVKDDITSLKLSTFTEKLLEDAKAFLTNGIDSAGIINITHIVAGDPMKTVISVNKGHLSGFFYGKEGKNVEWVREHFETEIYSFEYGNTTLVFMAAREESKLLEAQFDIWRSCSKIMPYNRFICRISIANFWKNLSLEEKVKYMNITKTFISHIPDMDSVLIRGFTSDVVVASKAKLKELVQFEKNDAD